jgi:hypothetical protein
MECYPAVDRLHTAVRLEYRGPDVREAVQRLMDDAWALPERTRDGHGWWLHDP